MNCQEFWDHLPVTGHDITEAQSAHLAECPACTARIEAQRSLSAGLRSMREESRHVSAPARVEAGLIAAFRSQSGSQVRHSLGSTWWTPVLAWASAAAAMIALAVVLVHGLQPSNKPGTVATPHHTGQSLVQTAALVDPDSDDESAVLGEGFVRLPNAPPLDPNESFDVVHVEAPGSELIAMGASLSEEQASEIVPADLALASDGTARAIRLVAGGGTN